MDIFHFSLHWGHMAQLMPLPLTVSCFSEIQIGFTFLVPAHPGSPRRTAVKRWLHWGHLIDLWHQCWQPLVYIYIYIQVYTGWLKKVLKSKLLILSEYVVITEKIDRRNVNKYGTSTEKVNHCLIFSREIFYVTIVLCLNILWLKASMKLLLGKHELSYVNMAS